MAGTKDDDTTFDNLLWWFLSSELAWLASRELAFVSKWIGEKAAKRYLRELLVGFTFMSGWYAELEIEEIADPRTGLITSFTSFPAVRRALWHDRDYPGIDWESSSAVYVGPVMRLHKNPDGSESVVRDCRASVRITVELLRFRHSLVVHNLCSRGLMPWSESVVEPVTQPVEQPESKPESKPKIDPFKTGGRPTAAHLVQAEARRRIKDGEVTVKRGGLSAFAKVLEEWWEPERQRYDPPGPPIQQKHIADVVRSAWNEALAKAS